MRNVQLEGVQSLGALKSAVQDFLAVITHPNYQPAYGEGLRHQQERSYAEYWVKEGCWRYESVRAIKPGRGFQASLARYLVIHMADVLVTMTPDDEQLHDVTWRHVMSLKWMYRQLPVKRPLEL